MPRFNLETLQMDTVGTVNLADMKVEGNRDVESDIQGQMLGQNHWKRVAKEITNELVRTCEKLLESKATNKLEILQRVSKLIDKKDLTTQEKQKMYERIEADQFGFGIMDKFMKDHTITELIIDSPQAIDVEVAGVLYRLGKEAPFENEEVFENDDELLHWTDNLLRMAPNERPLDFSNSTVNVDLENGERVQATCAPVTEHITVNIRKSVAQTKQYVSEDLVKLGTSNQIMMDFLLAATRGKATILILGPTGSGKTTVVRILLEKGTAPGERVLMIEETRETNPNILRFLSLQTVKHGNKKDAKALHEVCMRKRPNRVLLSEILGEEAAAFLMTTASGHPGGITSMHANGPDDAVFLLIMRMLEAGYEMSESFLERFVHNQLHLMVFITILEDGRRRMTSIVEVNSLDKANVPKFKDLFVWNPDDDTFSWVGDIEADKRRNWSINGAKVPVFTDMHKEEAVECGSGLVP